MTLKMKTGRDYVSYSALNSWQDCGWKFYLNRVQGLGELGAWWFVGGKAVHLASEWYDLTPPGEHSPGATALFHAAWEETMRLEHADEDPTQFRTGGRKTREYPNGEDHTWWHANGPAMVQNWINWRHDSGFQPFLINDKPAVEYGATLDFGGVTIKGFIDRIMVTPAGELAVIDLKSGKQTPASGIQLGTYAAIMQKALGIQPSVGYYWMARTGTLSQPFNLTPYTPDVVEHWVHGFAKAVEADIFIPHPSMMCGTCGFNDYCYAYNGSKAALYPPLSLDTIEGVTV